MGSLDGTGEDRGDFVGLWIALVGGLYTCDPGGDGIDGIDPCGDADKLSGGFSGATDEGALEHRRSLRRLVERDGVRCL